MAKKTICIAVVLLSVIALSGCLKEGDNKLFGGLIDFHVGKVDNEPEDADSSLFQKKQTQKSSTINVYEQEKQCYKTIECLEYSTFLHHYYAHSSDPEQHVKEIMELDRRHEIRGRNKDEFKYQRLLKEQTPRILKRISEAAQLKTVSILVPLPLALSKYDFDAQSFSYSLPPSANLSPLLIWDDRNNDPEYHHVPVFIVNFTNANQKTLPTFNIAEAEAATLGAVRRGTKGEGDARRSLKHRYVAPQRVYGQKVVKLKIKASLGEQRSMEILSDISEHKKQFKMQATILQYQLLHESGKILKTVDLFNKPLEVSK